jgi:GTPase
VVQFEEKDNVTVIDAEIHVERQSQKGIIVGKGGRMIKEIGTDARRSIEEFLQKKVYLELHVRVAENWKDSSLRLKNFGYRE